MATGLGGDRERATDMAHHNNKVGIRTAVHPEPIRIRPAYAPAPALRWRFSPYGLAAAQLPARAVPADLGLRAYLATVPEDPQRRVPAWRSLLALELA